MTDKPMDRPRTEDIVVIFRDAVLSEFSFLEKRGFRCVRAETVITTDPTTIIHGVMIEYLSERTRVYIYWFWRDGAGLSVRANKIVDEYEPKLHLCYILKYLDAPIIGEYPFYTRQDVVERVKDLAWMLERHAYPALDWDDSFMAIVKSHIAWGPEGDALAAEWGRIERARQGAEAAWLARDYAEAARLYAEVPEDKLTLIEAKKFSIARRKAQAI